jgi:2-dehydropantoate 2-reductase
LKVAIVGAGAVGLALGARLASSGHDVLFVTRRADTASAIVRDGAWLSDPVSAERVGGPASAVSGLEAAGAALRARLALLCTRSTETRALAAALARVAPDARIVSAQNDVDNEAALADHFEHVGGLVVRQTCTRVSENAALATGQGRLIVGRHPHGQDATLIALADALESAGYDVGRSDRIGADKWLKLVVNTTSAANALIRRPDHALPAFATVKIRLLEEARDVLDAAGIEARSCDGRDRSIDEEIAHLQGTLHSGTGGRALPLYNACWSALHDASKGLEADLYHARILALAAAHDVAAPTHATLLEALERARSEGAGPESVAAETLLHDEPEQR